ncbi:MAG TPA: TonB-dependent receptor, partial [Agriterribacter sp.]|nr:TonB-dependent receptor [Agriterribacter sp.]
LRAGWGMNGNQEGIGNYDYMKRYYKNPVTGDLTLVNFANPSLTWEKTTSVNIGLDITFLDSRIAVTADWYRKKTRDVLVRMPIPTTSGLNSISLNVGDMENKGFEFNIATQNMKAENWSWNTDFNMGFNRNKVLNLGDDPNVQIPSGEIYQRGNASLVKAGYPLGSFYGYVATGIDPQTGNVQYEDRDKNGETNPGDRTFIGNAQPDFIYGMTNTVRYKNIDLSVFFQGSQGNSIFNGARIETEGMYDSRNQTTVVLNRWQNPGDVTDVPRAIRNNVANTYISSRFLEDGSYLRLKAITLSYRFTGDFLRRMAVSNASLYVTGQNVLTFTSYTGFDPEVSTYGNDGNSNVKNIAQGIDYGAYPQSRAFIIGLNLTF